MEAPLASDVLGKYLELFQQNSYDFKYHFAPNSVIDWYGRRTIRGALKIHDYLRHEINARFQHCKFTDARICAPIETKTSHMRTKIITNKCVDQVHPINRVPDMVHLKPYADSDVEDNDHLINLSDVIVAKTNLLRTPDKSCIEDLTPPASASKEETEHATEYRSNQRSQKLKRSYNDSFECTPRAATTSKRAALHSGIHSYINDSSGSDDDDDLETLEALYSPLQYIEVKGVMRLRSSDVAESPVKHLFWKDTLERETHLKLSYRRCLENNHLQFALVIYEAVGASLPLPNPKCNLLMQFSLAGNSDDLEDDAATTTISKNETNVILTTDTITKVEEGLTQDADALAMAMSAEHMRTPTKLTHTPPPTPKRKPRSQMRTTGGRKRLNNSPSAPVPKRSAARSLRL